ncbi:classical arabinogalactan protein 2-like [Chenopodium quinoa]|uniref:classical arabinogalactan protein 2-like n=1 Tax=Chenopodium quinoa TaxID=63459 RepID=UPI000B76CCB5|nr:classical arabinogalactan protein 2-like [Chenopodium quinoa]
MGLSRVTLALTLIIVLVGSAFAQGPVVAPSQAPTTLSTPVASPVEAADAPIAETPTLAAMPPTDVTMDGPSLAPAPAPGPDGDQ